MPHLAIFAKVLTKVDMPTRSLNVTGISMKCRFWLATKRVSSVAKSEFRVRHKGAIFFSAIFVKSLYVQPISDSELVLNKYSIVFASKTLANFLKKSISAPEIRVLWPVREPQTASNPSLEKTN